jgi:GNAT superfamily N-acetyltransferase
MPKNHPSGLRLRAARSSDAPELIRLVDLAAPDELNAATAAIILNLPGNGNLTHGPCLCLVAELPDGTPIGALLSQPPNWIDEFAGADADGLTKRVGLIVAVAVDPAHRNRGAGSALVREAERRYRRAAFGLVMLYHEPELSGFYRDLGFSSCPALLANLPHSVLYLDKEDHLLTAVKPLEPRVHIVDVEGSPVPLIGGLLPRTAIPREARLAAQRSRA